MTNDIRPGDRVKVWVRSIETGFVPADYELVDKGAGLYRHLALATVETVHAGFAVVVFRASGWYGSPDRVHAVESVELVERPAPGPNCPLCRAADGCCDC